jgi:hypothetical protein
MYLGPTSAAARLSMVMLAANNTRTPTNFDLSTQEILTSLLIFIPVERECRSEISATLLPPMDKGHD